MTAPITNPFLGWHRCDECGAEADAPCCDMDDLPVTRLCNGRVGPGGKAYPAAMCQHCGTPTRLHGAARATGVTWCIAVKCQRAHKRAIDARYLDRKRAKVAPRYSAFPCAWCGKPASGHGRGDAKMRCCGDAECFRRIRSMRSAAARKRSERIAQQLASTNIDRQCGCCGAAFVACDSTQVYCGAGCKHRARKMRERQRKTAALTPSNIKAPLAC